MTPLDRLQPPDLWPEIERRAAAGAVDVPVRRPSRRPLVLAAAVAVVVAMVGVAAVLARGEGDDDRVDTGPAASTTTVVPTTTTSATTATTAPPVVGSDVIPELACLGGGLAGGSIPDDASTDPPNDGYTYIEGTQFRSWTEDGMAVALQVPSPGYYDLIGERTEEIDHGTLLYQDPQVVLLGGDSPCGYRLIVTGDDEAAARDLVLRIADRFTWSTGFGTTDCGPLSAQTIIAVDGPTAQAALTDTGIGGLELFPNTFERLSTATPTSDGRCSINAIAAGGVRVEATVSGSDGRYGLDAVRGYALDANDKSQIETDRALSVQVLGTSFAIHLDYWCDGCVVARMTLSYPEDGITATASADAEGEFLTGELPAPPTPGSFGILVITVEGPQDPGSVFPDLRGVFAGPIPSGDFAAG